MQINELTEIMHQFVKSKGWYKSNSNKPQTPKNLAISIALEASEILEYFQWSETCTDKTGLAGELADVTLFLLQLASISSIDLEKAVSDKLIENHNRTWDTPSAGGH
jgi:8-oxo-dGTP diphosphatase